MPDEDSELTPDAKGFIEELRKVQISLREESGQLQHLYGGHGRPSIGKSKKIQGEDLLKITKELDALRARYPTNKPLIAFEKHIKEYQQGIRR